MLSPSGSHLPPLPSGNTGTQPAWRFLLSDCTQTPLIFQSEHNPETRTHGGFGATDVSVARLCSLESSARREAGLFTARTFPRGLFLTKGRPAGFEPTFLNIQTRQIELQPGKREWCALNKTQPQPCFPSNFLEFISWQFQVLETQKRWVLPPGGQSLGRVTIPLKRWMVASGDGCENAQVCQTLSGARTEAPGKLHWRRDCVYKMSRTFQGKEMEVHKHCKQKGSHIQRLIFTKGPAVQGVKRSSVYVREAGNQ